MKLGMIAIAPQVLLFTVIFISLGSGHDSIGYTCNGQSCALFFNNKKVGDRERPIVAILLECDHSSTNPREIV
jgi:hypothetical protein